MADTPGLNDIRLDHKPLSPIVISCALSDKGMYERCFGNEKRTSTTSRLWSSTDELDHPYLRPGSADVIFLPLGRNPLASASWTQIRYLFNLLSTVEMTWNVCLDSYSFILRVASEDGLHFVDEPLVTVGGVRPSFEASSIH